MLLIGQLGYPRVAHWWQLPRPGAIGLDQFVSATMSKDFLIYLPENYGDTETWPLVVFLHGSGERGTDPSRLRNKRPISLKLAAIVVVPPCLPSCSWEPDAVAGLVTSVTSRYRIDRNRIYLVGCSMGGYGAWATAAGQPELFAAIVPICGGGDPNQAKSLAGIPVWAFHGAADDVVPLAASEHMIEAIRNLGDQPRLTILCDMGHGICQTVCERADLWECLFKQRRSRRWKCRRCAVHITGT